jgi:pyruvate formate-lyase activating enzyme-like uncharacterized protein
VACAAAVDAREVGGEAAEPVDWDAWRAGNRDELGDRTGALDWRSAAQARAEEAERDALVAEVLALGATEACGGTKLDGRGLSPGCQRCAEGAWSCLFVNGVCNAKCFYCPTPQTDVGPPTTNLLAFPDPADYVDYLRLFGFTGASLSGGEPLLSLETCLAFVRAIREGLGDGLHLWLYTNGKLADGATMRALADAGLDEIRFDLTAVDYDARCVREAVGTIATVTVEIPAIPGDLGRLKALAADLAGAGVNHLNLHQLRATPHNLGPLIDHGLSLLHGPRPVVAGSETTALRLLRHTLATGLPLPVNYCGFRYKSGFQAAAARRRAAPLAARPGEDVTEAGLLRRLVATGPAEAVGRQVAGLGRAGVAPTAYAVAADGCGLTFGRAAAPHLDLAGLALEVTYLVGVVRPAPTFQFPFVEVRLASGRKLTVERRPVAAPAPLSGVAGAAFLAAYLLGPSAAAGPRADLDVHERLPTGLMRYVGAA